MVAGGIAGAAVTTPIDYAAMKMSDKYKNDKNFHAGHMAAILLPAGLSATYGMGAMTNTIDQMKKAGTQGTVQTVKNIISPKKNIAAAKNELSNISNIFKGKGKIGSGLLAAAMVGSSLIDPAMYAIRTLGKKKESKMEKTASRIRKKILTDAIAGKLILATAGVAGAEEYYRRRKKQVKLSLRSISPRHISLEDVRLARTN